MEKITVFMNTANVTQLRTFVDELGIVNDDHSFDEFLEFLKGLIVKNEK